MPKLETPELEPNELGLKLKSRAHSAEKTEKHSENSAHPHLKKSSMKERVKHKEKEIVLHIRKEQEETQPVHHKIKHHPQPKKSLFRNFTQLIDFLLFSGVIFIAVFLIFNFTAYKQIVLDFVFPEEQIKSEDNLNKFIGQKPKKEILVLPDPSKKLAKKVFPVLTLTVAPPDNRIIIPKIARNIPLVEMDAKNLQGENWVDLEKQIQEGLRNGVVHYPGTAVPGQFGNVFITGHSSYYPWDPGQYKDVFALLPKMAVGDIYYIFYNQKKYTYRIREKKEVAPSNVQVLNQPPQEQISTLMTCVPVGTALRRLIIVAEQI